VENDDWIRLFKQSFADLNAGAIAAAEKTCKILLEYTPDDPRVTQLMAAIRLASGDFADAERFAQASLVRRPDHAPTIVLAGMAARKAGKLDLAANCFRRATALDPARPDAAFQACIVQIERMGADVVQLFGDLHVRFPGHASGWVEIGRALDGVGQSRLALSAFDLAFQTAPTAYLAYKRGELLYDLRELRQAESALRYSATADGNQFSTWFKLGLVLQDLRDLAGAVDAYRRALAVRSESAEAETNLGIALQDSGDLRSAKAAYGRAMLVAPESFARIAQALAMAPTGELWLDMGALQSHLLDEGRRSLVRRSR